MKLTKNVKAKVHWTIMSFLLFNSSLFAQWSLSLTCQTYPSPYISDWATIPGIVNITITYTDTKPISVRLKSKLVSSKHGEIASGESDTIHFGRPQTVRRDNRDFLNYDNIKYNQTYQEQITRTGRLLEGTYTLSVVLVNNRTGVILDRKSAVFYILSFSPPSLITPPDSEIILIQSPTFQWTPATFYHGFTVRYHLRICEMRSGQTPQVAINNIAHHQEIIENRTIFIYPNTARALEEGKNYVWQVQARDRNGVPIGENEGKSEIRHFRREFIISRPPNEIRAMPVPLRIFRYVTRVGNYFEVIVEIANHDTVTIRNIKIVNKQVGFQCRSFGWMRKRRIGGTWTNWHGYLLGKTADNWDGTGCTWQWGEITRLAPDSAIQVKYHIVPILFSVEKQPPDYIICDSLRITYRMRNRDYLVRRDDLRYIASTIVHDAFRTADYLIVTCPAQLFAHNVGTADTVNELLGTIAELAETKNGVLGYIPFYWTAGDLRTEISPGQRWMEKLSHNWINQGYLLLVGNRDIVPMHLTVVDPNWGLHELVDYPYANLSGDHRPELAVGRIIGNGTEKLIIPIKTAITGNNRATDVLIVTGYEGVWEEFIKEAETGIEFPFMRRTIIHTEYFDLWRNILNEALVIKNPSQYDFDNNSPQPNPNTLSDSQVVSMLLGSGGRLTNIRKRMALDSATHIQNRRRGGSYGNYNTFPTGADVLRARANAVKERIREGRDLIFWNGHGNSVSWSAVLDSWESDCGIEPLDLGGRAPVIYAASCLTGCYWETNSIARAFLERGAVCYIGITKEILTVHNYSFGESFANLYAANRDSTIGRVFKILNDERMRLYGTDQGWKNVVYRYHLYGDPKFKRR